MTLIPILVQNSVIYEPEGSDYHYRVNWRRNYGYQLQRRSIKNIVGYVEIIWDKHSLLVEDYIQLTGGQFDLSLDCRTVVRFETLADAEAVINDDILKTTID